MYLKSLIISNFRKFGLKNNKIEFVDAKSYQEQKQGKEINIAPTTTLIVGKNNSGKTTIINALDILINNKGNYKANDFNFSYLKSLLEQYEKSTENVETPYLQINIVIGIEDNSNDLITNLVPFMVLEDVDKSELEILVKFELEDEASFIRDVKKIFGQEQTGTIRFKKFLELINESRFKINYYNANGEVVNKFNISNLIELRAIKANNIESEYSLSKAFSTIIKYRFNTLIEEGEQELDKSINSINKSLTDIIKERHTKDINESLGKIESIDKLEVLLSADLTFEKLINNLIKYEYIEQNNNIPENQFGLGYTNLMMLIANLIEYMEKYPESSFNSRVNLISIEEPETFMHPQMQELFIKNINDAIAVLLQSKNKNVNSQLIITTHSSHILNSKIHTGNTFDSINYVTIYDEHSHVVNLRDDIIVPKNTKSIDKETENDKERENNLKFLKKHIKYKVSELFFSDAIIFVEGITEETLLKYYIDQTDGLNKYYISVFNIDGAHGLVYHELINLLKVPALIITDLDIKRDEKEKEAFEQVTDLKDRVTTNKTIKKYNSDSDQLKELPKKIEINNMYLAYQKNKIEGYYATSFEEAFILTNFKNSIINGVLKKMKPEIYKEVLGKDTSLDNIKENSYKLQIKLSKNKSDFANELLYQYITEETQNVTIPSLPEYIKSGLTWLTKKLEGEK
ncbi:AAA family ATPase [Brevibacillus porteri]|uniref:ATP-dependent nuclease n=1 Tax=Brevibacillus porteri TaxID=2126350 RepID=UPI003D24A8EE